MNTLREILTLAPVVPVLTIHRVADALPLARALMEGGLPVLEVTLRTQAGLEAIEVIARELPDAVVGAGTATTAAQFQAACDSGSRFVVSPGLSTGLIDVAANAAVPLLPGVATASEVMWALDAGLDTLKFFPAESAGGVSALRGLSGPFAQVRFCPTGGISLSNLADYLALGNVLTVGGSWMAPAGAIGAQDWNRIRDLAREAADRAREAGGAQ